MERKRKLKLKRIRKRPVGAGEAHGYLQGITSFRGSSGKMPCAVFGKNYSLTKIL